MRNKVLLDKKAEKAAKKFGLTSDQVKLLQDSAYGLYHYLGSDIPAEKKDGTCSRAILLEVITDAGRLEEDVRKIAKLTSVNDIRYKKAVDKDKDHPLIKACRDRLIEDIIGPAFVFDRYEVGAYDASFE